MSDELIERLTEQRARAWEQAKGLLDAAASENRDLTGEESEQFERINADIDAMDHRRKSILDAEARERAIDESRAALGLPADFTSRTAPVQAEKSDADIIREIALGERRSYSFEQRGTSSSRRPVPRSRRRSTTVWSSTSWCRARCSTATSSPS
jgi:hypothetical protein